MQLVLQNFYGFILSVVRVKDEMSHHMERGAAVFMSGIEMSCFLLLLKDTRYTWNTPETDY